MRVTKCDLCKKSIRGEAVTAGVGFYRRAELCVGCGKPVLDFLNRHKLSVPDNSVDKIKAFIKKEKPEV